ncbi:hypothetical protein FOL47_000008 [Perkinsus chesapeaki]|uniref:Uncharacterized protein n=1 Tax=Perkinsus chesapeaki TaxID=330153 RepID=A0A7J6N5T1_PERCH|nr:hypothetical protein FOL47_000008 [Perkinsus chesapeaki]
MDGRRGRPSTAPARSNERITRLLQTRRMKQPRILKKWEDVERPVVKPKVVELTRVQSWLKRRNMPGTRKLTFVEEQDLRRLFRMLDARGEGVVPSAIVQALLSSLNEYESEGNDREKRESYYQLGRSMNETDFVRLMEGRPGGVDGVSSSVIPVDIAVAAAYRRYELNKMSTTAKALTEHLTMLATRLRSRRDIDHVWGQTNPTGVQLFSPPRPEQQQQRNGGLKSTRSLQCHLPITGHVAQPPKEEMESRQHEGLCIYFKDTASGGQIWEYWPPLKSKPSKSHAARVGSRGVRHVRTCITTGEVHLIQANGHLCTFDPDAGVFQQHCFPQSDDIGLPYRWATSARTTSALYLSSKPASGSHDWEICWTIPSSPKRWGETRSTVPCRVESPLPPAKAGRSVDLSEYFQQRCPVSIVDVAETSSSVYWLLGNGSVIHLSDRHLFARVKPRGTTENSMPPNKLAKISLPATKDFLHTLFEDPFLAPRARMLSIRRAVSSIAAGWKHALFLSHQGGAVFGLGDNTRGQLGLPEGRFVATAPIQLTSLGKLTVKSIACGGLFSLCLGQDGTISAFGCSRKGQLGCGNVASSPTSPACLTLPDGASLISCAPETACALTKTGRLFVWGAFHAKGELPDPAGSSIREVRTTTNHFEPVEIPLKRGSDGHLPAGNPPRQLAVTSSTIFLLFT